MSKELAERLSKIQKTLVCKKTRFNAFGKYNYRSLEDIFDALKEHLKDGLYVVIDEDLQLIGDRFYIKATAYISDGVNSISATSYARESESKKGMDTAQVTVSTSSYASKSSMQKLFMLDDTNNSHDIDNQDNSQTTTINQIKRLINEKNVNELDFLKHFKVKGFSELTYDKQQKALEMLKKK